MLRYLPLLLLLPAAALAQTPEIVAKVDAKLDAERAAQRNEDVEILRRLLNKACGLPNEAGVSVAEHPVQRFTNARDYDPMIGTTRLPPRTVQVAQSTAPVGPFDGVYLPGAGVVFTLHVPGGVPKAVSGERIGLLSSCGSCHQPQAHSAVSTAVSLASCTACHTDVPKGEPALSEWERVKQDVRGETPKPADKPKGDKPRAAVCEPGSLHTLIAGVLAANAKNVRHLGEKEGVTVVVTFDDVKPAIHVETPAADESPRFTADEAKMVSLADLHMKVGKYGAACDAYGEALGRFTAKEFKWTAPPTLTPEQRNKYTDEFQKGVRDAMKSYAKALLLADQPEAAKKALELATGFVVLEVTPTTVPAKATGPAKLIVRVTKADLDAAKDGAAFKKAVKAERVNFLK